MEIRPASVIIALALSVSGPAAAQDVAEGERLFRQRCASCHSATAGQNRIGPHLAGVIGRRSGGVDGARYSNALRSYDMVWSPESLDSFLSNPRRTVPGTTMSIAIRDDEDRGDIIAFLASLSGT